MGKDRLAQREDPTEKQKNIREVKPGSVPVGNISDTGALSSRNDASGGSGDGMEHTNSSEPTKRF